VFLIAAQLTGEKAVYQLTGNWALTSWEIKKLSEGRFPNLCKRFRTAKNVANESQNVRPRVDIQTITGKSISGEKPLGETGITRVICNL